MKILPGRGWARLLRVLQEEQGTVLLLGATDSGKTTLARYLVEHLAGKCLPTALIDSDIGQSSLGLPGTISMKVFLDDNDLADFSFERMSFLGFVNPAKVMPLMVAITKRFATIVRREAATVIVDTTGLISGELGKTLKMAKIKALRPAHIVAIQRDDELDHILSGIEAGRVHRLNASPEIKRRSISVRATYRKRKLEKYFRERKLFTGILDGSAVSFFYRGRVFHHEESELPQGAIIGLNRNDSTSALGIIEAVAGTVVNFRSPLRSIKMINRVVCGDMTMSQDPIGNSPGRA